MTVSANQQYCTFTVDGMCFGIDVQKVQEAIRFQEMTRVPLADPTIRGLINLRGQIVTAVDLRLRLGLTPREGDRQPMNVILRTDDGPVSLLVDEVGDVLQVNSEQFESPPDRLTGIAREVVNGVYKLEGCLLLILDTERVLEIDEAKLENSHAA